MQLRHDLMRAKLHGFLDRPDTVLRAYPPTDHVAAGALCPGDCHLSLRRSCARRVAQIDGLIQSQPNNPYFYELKGQALLESRPAGRSHRAVAPGASRMRPIRR